MDSARIVLAFGDGVVGNPDQALADLAAVTDRGLPRAAGVPSEGYDLTLRVLGYAVEGEFLLLSSLNPRIRPTDRRCCFFPLALIQVMLSKPMDEWETRSQPTSEPENCTKPRSLPSRPCQTGTTTTSRCTGLAATF